MKGERGLILGILMIMSFVLSTAAFAMLSVGVGRANTSGRVKDRAQARYAAEAGLVWAMQRLWASPGYCGELDPPALGGLTVDVTVTNCGAGLDHQLSAKVVY